MSSLKQYIIVTSENHSTNIMYLSKTHPPTNFHQQPRKEIQTSDSYFGKLFFPVFFSPHRPHTCTFSSHIILHSCSNNLPFELLLKLLQDEERFTTSSLTTQLSHLWTFCWLYIHNKYNSNLHWTWTLSLTKWTYDFHFHLIMTISIGKYPDTDYSIRIN